MIYVGSYCAKFQDVLRVERRSDYYTDLDITDISIWNLMVIQVLFLLFLVIHDPLSFYLISQVKFPSLLSSESLEIFFFNTLLIPNSFQAPLQSTDLMLVGSTVNQFCYYSIPNERGREEVSQKLLGKLHMCIKVDRHIYFFAYVKVGHIELFFFVREG